VDVVVIGERIRAARKAAGLNQRQLAQRIGLSAMAVSKYESGKLVPGSAVLLQIAEAVNLPVDYFLRPTPPLNVRPQYRKTHKVTAKVQARIEAKVAEWLERYFAVEALFPTSRPSGFHIPSDVSPAIHEVEEAEQVAVELRQAWELGLDPISSMVDLLEEHGVRVGQIEEVPGFDALAFWAQDDQPVIVVARNTPGDRQRFSMAHELGHIVLRMVNDVDEEKAAHRFAAAFLAPRSVVYREMGERRKAISPQELLLLKHKYGMSMQAWIFRAHDLRIVTDAVFRQWMIEFHRRGWHKEEPGPEISAEQPHRMERLVQRALAEGLISLSRAAELLGLPLGEIQALTPLGRPLPDSGTIHHQA